MTTIDTQEEMDSYIKSNRHFILYCKNWYNETATGNVINDLTIIFEEYCGLENISKKHLYVKMLDLYFNLMEEGEFKDNLWYNLFDNFFIHKDYVTMDDIIERIVNKLVILNVIERKDNLIINLGKPDLIKFSYNRFRNIKEDK